MPFLTGEYFHAIDAKSRLTIPAKLREAVNQTEEGYGFVAVRGFDGVLYLYTPKTYTRIAPQFDTTLQTKADVRNYERLLYALAEHLDVDGLGRVLIPDSTRKRCGLAKEVAIIGVKDHIEVWDRARWETFIGEQLADHDDVAARAVSAAKEEAAKPTAAGQHPV